MKRRYDQLLLSGIFLLALFFRFWKVEDYFIFSGETNNLFYYIEEFLHGDRPWLMGLEAAQYIHHLFHLPWYLYAMIPIYLAGSGDPLVFALFHALIGVLGSLSLFYIGTLFGSRTTGLLAAFGWAIWLRVALIERFVSPVSLVPFGIITTLLIGLTAKKRLQMRWFFLFGFWSGFIVSFHYALLTLPIAVLTWVSLKQRNFLWTCFLGVIFAFSPMIFFDIRHQFFNTIGLVYVGKSLFDGSRPYGSSHFLYQLYPFVVLLCAWFISRLPKPIAMLIVSIFFMIQVNKLWQYKTAPNYHERSLVVRQLLQQWDNGLRIFFKDHSSFDYAYLLRWEARRRGLDFEKIELYEPWQPDNNACLLVNQDQLIVRCFKTS